MTSNLPAVGGQFEALGPAVDGGLLQRPAVEAGAPAGGGLVGDAQDPARRAGRDLGVDVDGVGGDRQTLAALGRHDHRTGDLAVHPPQRAAVELAEPAEARRRVQGAGERAGRAVAHQHIAHRESAELARLVGAGARDEVGDDLAEPGVVAAGRGEFGVAELSARAAYQGVRDLGGRGAAEHQGAGLVAGAALLGDERGHLHWVAPLQRAVGAADHPVRGGVQGAEHGGERDQGGDRLAPAEAVARDAGAAVFGAERGGGEQREPVRRGSPGPPRRSVGQDREEEPDERDRPGGADGERAVARSRAARAAATMPMSSSPPTALGPPGLAPSRSSAPAEPFAVREARFLEEAGGAGRAGSATRARASAAGWRRRPGSADRTP